MKLESTDFLDKLFARKDGYQLNHVLATTFTLSTAILPTLLLRAASSAANRAVPKDSDSAEMVLAGIKSAGSLLTVFADGRPDCIIPPHGKPSKMQWYINKYCIPHCVVRVNTGKASTYFHPKLFLIDFVETSPANGNIPAHFIRGAVLSKNLTFEKNVVEVGCLFETSDDASRVVLQGAGPEIAGLFESLKGNQLAENWISDFLAMDAAQKRIKPFLQEIKSATFRLTADYSGYAPTSAQLLMGTPKKPLLTKYPCLEDDLRDAAYWCSDSVSEEFITSYNKKFLTEYNKKHRTSASRLVRRPIISNIHSWATRKDFATAALSPDFQKKLAFEQSAEKERLRKVNGLCCVTLSEGSPVFVHAKFLEVYRTNETVLLLGSANFTANAFLHNYECDVRLCFAQKPAPFPVVYSVTQAETLDPKPFLYDGPQNKPCNLVLASQSVVAAKLDTENTYIEFEKKLRELKWTVAGIGNAASPDKIRVTSSYLDPKALTPDEWGWLSQLQIDLNGLYLAMNYDSQTQSFWAESESFSPRYVPEYGVSTLLYFPASKEENNKVKSIQINIETQKLPPRTPSMDDGDPGISAALLGGRFSLRSLIPPEPLGDYQLYDTSDTVDIRLAKYNAKGGDLEAVLKNADLRLKSLSLEMADEDGDDEEEPPTAEEIQNRRRRINEFKCLIYKMREEA